MTCVFCFLLCSFAYEAVVLGFPDSFQVNARDITQCLLVRSLPIDGYFIQFVRYSLNVKKFRFEMDEIYIRYILKEINTHASKCKH